MTTFACRHCGKSFPSEEFADHAEYELNVKWSAPEIYQGYGEEHADYLGEDPFADTIEERNL